jgi:site-specific recombinase XerD
LTYSRSGALLVATKRLTLRPGAIHMRLSQAVEAFIKARTPHLSASTLRAYESALNLLVAQAHIDARNSVLEFTPTLVRAFIQSQSAKGLAQTTMHLRYTAIKEFGRWGAMMRYWQRNPVDEVQAIRQPKTLPRPFTREERTRIMELALPPQEAALRALLFFTGRRISELCNIRLRDINLAPDLSYGGLRVRGKGGKEMVIPFGAEVVQALINYLDGAPLTSRMFLFQLPNGKCWHRRAAEYRTRAWGRSANVPECTPHRFRHVYATMLLERGARIEQIQQLLGHASIATTMVYTKVAETTLLDAVRLLSDQPDHSGTPYRPAPESAR